MKIVLLGTFILFSIYKVHAGELLNANIVSIQSYTNGTIGVVTNDQTINPASCTSTIKYIIPPTEDGGDKTLSLLLTAKVTSSLINIYFHDSACSSGYPRIKSIILK